MADTTESLTKKRRKYTINHFRLRKHGGRAVWTNLPSELVGIIAVHGNHHFTGRLALSCKVFCAAIDTAWKNHRKNLEAGADMPGKLIQPNDWFNLLEGVSLDDIRLGVHILRNDTRLKWDLKESYYTYVFNWKVHNYRLLPAAKDEIIDYATGRKAIRVSYSLVPEKEMKEIEEAGFVEQVPPFYKLFDRNRWYCRLLVSAHCENSEQDLDFRFGIIPTENYSWGEQTTCAEAIVIVKLIN